jgi:two-component system sensor histidine kinase TctE
MSGSVAHDGEGRRSGAHLRVVDGAREAPDDQVHRHQVSHDIQHELSTIMMLAATVKASKDVGRVSQTRVEQILAETRWLSELLRAYDRDLDERQAPSPVRLDLTAVEILRPVRMSSTARIVLEASAVSATVDRLGFWRALRNLICNAIRAVGDTGCVVVRVSSADGAGVVEVEDDGPGFDPAAASPTSLGLTIVADFVERHGGTLSIGRGELGGCAVRMLVPEAR